MILFSNCSYGDWNSLVINYHWCYRHIGQAESSLQSPKSCHLPAALIMTQTYVVEKEAGGQKKGRERAYK